jgi:hypothetical protein
MPPRRPKVAGGKANAVPEGTPRNVSEVNKSTAVQKRLAPTGKHTAKPNRSRHVLVVSITLTTHSAL